MTVVARPHCGRTALRDYAATHFKEALPDVSGCHFQNELFSECTFGRVRGAEFKNCVLAGSNFEADDIRDILGVTLTLDCFTFENMEPSALALDAILFLLTMTRGNGAARQKIEAAIDPERLEKFRRLFPRTT